MLKGTRVTWWRPQLAPAHLFRKPLASEDLKRGQRISKQNVIAERGRKGIAKDLTAVQCRCHYKRRYQLKVINHIIIIK